MATIIGSWLTFDQGLLGGAHLEGSSLSFAIPLPLRLCKLMNVELVSRYYVIGTDDQSINGKWGERMTLGFCGGCRVKNTTINFRYVVGWKIIPVSSMPSHPIRDSFSLMHSPPIKVVRFLSLSLITRIPPQPFAFWRSIFLFSNGRSANFDSVR